MFIYLCFYTNNYILLKKIIRKKGNIVRMKIRIKMKYRIKINVTVIKK